MTETQPRPTRLKGPLDGTLYVAWGPSLKSTRFGIIEHTSLRGRTAEVFEYRFSRITRPQRRKIRLDGLATHAPSGWAALRRELRLDWDLAVDRKLIHKDDTPDFEKACDELMPQAGPRAVGSEEVTR